MRNPDSAFRARALSQVALIVLIAGATAACSGSKRLSEPFFTGSTDNQRQIINPTASADYQPMPGPVSNASVSRSNLPPPSDYGAAYASADSSIGLANSSTWTPVGGQTVRVGPSDTLDNLAAKFGVPQEQILVANQLSNSSQITQGTTLIIPRRVAGGAMQEAIPASAYAPQQAPIAEAPTLMANGGDYVVQPGDTLFGIARRNNTTVASLVSLNGLVSAESIRSGQTLRLDGAAQQRPTTVAALGAPEKPLGQLRVSSDGTAIAAPANPGPQIDLPAPADAVMQAPAAPAMPAIPTIGGTEAASQGTATAAATVDDAADVASADGKSFRWPVRGRIISGFGTKPNGERNDGINLAVPEGTSVKAVEAGSVIYAGNELEGYGNLVLIRHADGWVSAYAHNKEILVKRGDQIRRGQTVGYAGMTGSVTSPQVHFELRKGAKPVNPLDYLAGA
jgi:murein DD-endopeptidase MepM/ murein hydrolase activator NlpD